MNKNVKIALIVTSVVLVAGTGVFLYLRYRNKPKTASAAQKFNRSITFEKV